MEQNVEKNPKIDEFLQKFSDLLKEFNVTPEIELTFPDYKNLPTEVQLALVVINKHNNQFNLNFRENNNAN
jgi:hypothetical protein